MTDVPWLDINDKWCPSCQFPVSHPDAKAIILAQFDGDFGLANVPQYTSYRVPLAVCESKCF